MLTERYCIEKWESNTLRESDRKTSLTLCQPSAPADRIQSTDKGTSAAAGAAGESSFCLMDFGISAAAEEQPSMAAADASFLMATRRASLHSTAGAGPLVPPRKQLSLPLTRSPTSASIQLLAFEQSLHQFAQWAVDNRVQFCCRKWRLFISC